MPIEFDGSINRAQVEEYLKARERKRKASGKKLGLYFNDPVAFINDCVDFGDKGGLTFYQEEVMAALVEKKRVAQRGPHGLGKTTTAALLILWFALTRDGAGADWKCPTTAGAWRQLEDYLWPEVAKWAKCLRWDRIGREPFLRHELLRLNLNLDYGSARALASNVPAYIEGAHADQILYIFDESKAIIDATFDAAEGAFSGAGVDGREAFALASSTPGNPSGRFYQIHQQGNPLGRPRREDADKSQFGDWWTRHITMEETIKAGRNSTEWANARKVQFGADSQMYFNRVLGEFHADETDTIIPLSWIEAAQLRWMDHQEETYKAIDRVGVDVARSGSDQTVIATVTGQRVHSLKYSFHEDIPKTAKRVEDIMMANPEAICTIDADGLGSGVFDLVGKVTGWFRTRAFHASGATDWKDETGELQFLNVRASAWWNLRQKLDPKNASTWELPMDDQLTADLCAPRWSSTARGKIQVESKEEIKKRIEGKSTDSADAVIHAVWEQRKRRRRRMGNMGLVPESSEDALAH